MALILHHSVCQVPSHFDSDLSHGMFGQWNVCLTSLRLCCSLLCFCHHTENMPELAGYKTGEAMGYSQVTPVITAEASTDKLTAS